MTSALRHLFLTLFCLFSASAVMCQNNPRVFQHFKSENGLSQNSVFCISQDKEGYIWISNYDGINKFDGHHCKIITGQDSTAGKAIHAQYFFKDHLHRIWILNSNVFVRYDPQTGKITTLSDNPEFKKSLKHVDLTALAEDNSGTIWLGTRNGLYQFDERKNTYTRFVHDTVGTKDYTYSKNRIRGLLCDGRGTLWVSTLSGLFKFSVATHAFTPVFKTVDNPNSRMDDVSSMTFDATGNIWLAIVNGGIRVIDTTTNKITYINTKTTGNQLNSDDVGALLCDKNGNIWISHITKGINIYHPQTNAFESYRHDEADPHSLGDDRTTSLFEDKTGMIWIGTETEGADAVSAVSPKFNTYTQHPGKPGALCEKGITCSTEDKDGNLWIGSQNGLMFFNRKTNLFSCYHHEENKPNSLYRDYVQALKMDRNGLLWVGTDKGLNTFDPIKGKWNVYLPDKSVPASLPSDNINGICERSNGEVWITCNNSICRYVPEKDAFENVYTNTAIKLLKPEFYTAIFEDSRKKMWVATSRSGVYQLDDAFNILQRYYYDAKKPNGICDNTINGFAEDVQGKIWMATDNGLCKFDPQTRLFSVYNTKNSLSSNLITQVEITGDGAIWLGTCLGLTQLTFDKTGMETVKDFTVADGLQSNVFYSFASAKLRSGELFFGGSKGFNLFKPGDAAVNKLIPEVKISSFSIFDKELDSLPMLHLQNKIKLDYRQNFFSFDMAAMSFDSPEKNQYAYQLEGFDKSIIYCGTQNHVSYTNVPPGKYTLHIIASNNDGLWNNEGLRICIEITPPFWKTWWFITILSIVALILFTLLIRYIFNRRLKKRLVIIEQQREIENIRSRISRDIHDEIGSGLTRISLLSELVKSNTDKSNKDVPLLEKIISSSREISSSLSEIIWTVNPEHDNLESLLSYMRNYINGFFEDAAIACKISFPEDAANSYIHPDIKRNLFLVLKESLNNVLKHAQAKNVTVAFSTNGGHFKLIITDDGTGIPENKKNKFGNGLRNMHSRAQSMNATCSVVSAHNGGTTITIEGTLGNAELKK